MVLIFSGFLAIFRTFIAVNRAYNCTSDLYANRSNCNGSAVFELILWGIVMSLVLVDLAKNHQFGDFFNLCGKVFPFLLLVLLSWLSLIWTLNLPITLTKSIFLSAASLSAIYIGLRYSIRSIYKPLAVFFALISILSLLIIFLLPEGGRMNFAPYDGAWRGIFRNKNYLGAFIAYGNILFLIRLLSGKRGLFQTIITGLFYALTLLLVIKSDSAAGVMTLIILNLLVFMLLGWIKIKDRLTKKHYIVLFSLMGIVLTILLMNLDGVFGIFNRNVSLTGRIPMWQYLYEHYINNRLLLGHGYGVVWSYETFRTGLQSAMGWGYPLVMGDNGFIDISLHLGVTGVLISGGILIFAFIKTFIYGLRKVDLVSFLPLLTIIYGILVNISLSLFTELDYFVWMLMIFFTVFVIRDGKGKFAKDYTIPSY